MRSVMIGDTCVMQSCSVYLHALCSRLSCHAFPLVVSLPLRQLASPGYFLMHFPSRQSLTAFVLLLSLSQYVLAHPSSSAVEELTDLTTIDSYISSSHQKPLLLQFYAPWCSHCRNFAPTYEHIATELENEAAVARIDGSQHRIATHRFRVKGFPSFYLIHARTVTKFVGARSSEALAQFVRSRGNDHGQKLNYIGGPLSPYWSAVSSVFWVADLARQRVTQYQQDGGSLILLVFCIVIGVLSAFVLVIYIITSPSKYASQPTTTHQHAE